MIFMAHKYLLTSVNPQYTRPLSVYLNLIKCTRSFKLPNTIHLTTNRGPEVLGYRLPGPEGLQEPDCPHVQLVSFQLALIFGKRGLFQTPEFSELINLNYI